MRRGLVAILIAGLALLTLVVALVGFGSVFAAISAAGLTGFGAYTLYWPVVLLILGSAWFAVAPGLKAGRLWVLIWARMLREAGSDILPLAQVSGFLLGARAATAEGVAEDLVLASSIVDMTAELVAQLLYTLLGLALLALQLHEQSKGLEVFWPVAGALLFLSAAGLGLVLVQGRGVTWLGDLIQRWLPNSVTRAFAVRAMLDAIYRRPLRFAAGVMLHLLGWIGGSAGSFIALAFMGVDAPFRAILAVESLMYAARSVAFVMPGGLGVQEGAYVLLGPLFGLEPSNLVAVSLLRRARDLVVGIPTLLLWQAREGRFLFGAKPKAAPDDLFLPPDGEAAEVKVDAPRRRAAGGR
jgi:putative membrane protein